MTQTQPTPITLAGQPAALLYDRHARFRFGQRGGNLNALLAVPGQDYFQSILLLWAGLDAVTRARYPDPGNLVDHVAEDDDEIYTAVLTAVKDAGWLQLAE